MKKNIVYCTGFWCTNIGNAFFSLGIEYVLKKILGENNVTIVSDLQTYTTSYGKRLYPDKNQLEYISLLDAEYIVLAGPVISRYFLQLWENILIELERKGIRYIILSAGMMKMTETSLRECKTFFENHPPFIFATRDHDTYNAFGRYAEHSYDGICFSFFAPDYYIPVSIREKYITLNFDKISEPKIWRDDSNKLDPFAFEFNNGIYHVKNTSLLTKLAYKTDRFSDALIYMASMLPQKEQNTKIDEYKIVRTDHRFHPHYRRKIYRHSNSFCADLPFGYLNIYANSALTLSDRVHACAVTMAYGNPAMLFTETNRVGLLERVGAKAVTYKPTQLDMKNLNREKALMLEWLDAILR